MDLQKVKKTYEKMNTLEFWQKRSSLLENVNYDWETEEGILVRKDMVLLEGYKKILASPEGEAQITKEVKEKLFELERAYKQLTEGKAK